MPAEAPKVTERTVKRYYANGNGFARESDAWKYLAKLQFYRMASAYEVDQEHQILAPYADDMDLVPMEVWEQIKDSKFFHRYFVLSFPPCKERCCWSGDPEDDGRAFCRTAWKAWIDRTAKELKEAAQTNA